MWISWPEGYVDWKIPNSKTSHVVRAFTHLCQTFLNTLEKNIEEKINFFSSNDDTKMFLT